jgi:hypothetical protein
MLAEPGEAFLPEPALTAPKTLKARLSSWWSA